MQIQLRSLVPAILVVIALILAGLLMFAVSSREDSTKLEDALVQFIILSVTVWASYFFGKNAAEEAARDVLRPHARSAFRRVLTLYASLYDLSGRIEAMKGQGQDHRLDLMQAVVHEQIRTGQDAIEDWRDIIPDEVRETIKRSREQTQVNERHGSTDEAMEDWEDIDPEYTEETERSSAQQ